MSHLGDYFHCERKCRMLTLAQVARLVGYRNINKGVRRLLLFEQKGFIKTDLLVKVAEALHMDWQIIEELADDDRQERLRAWEAWANEPVPMRMVVRLAAAVYRNQEIPPEITTQEQAETWACDFAAKNQKQVCLVVSRRLSVWIDQYGTITARTEAEPDELNEPYMQIGNKQFRLD